MTHILNISGYVVKVTNDRVGSLHTSIHTRMLKFDTQIRNLMPRTIMRSRMTHVLHASSQEP